MTAAPARPGENTPATAGRLLSLDVFRGLTIAAMILVNDPGSWQHLYAPLRHAEWHGWTHTDLIFPFFLFISGVSLVFSFRARLANGSPRAELLRHALRRAALIVLIGLLLHWFPFRWEKLFELRYPGVLQRIGLCYAAGAVVFLYGSRRARIAVTAALLAGYYLLLKFVPVPGYGAGNWSPEGNLGAFIDRALMSGHLWSQSKTWDPEGLLSTLPAIATLLLGTFAGELLAGPAPWSVKVKRMGIAGVAGLALGLLAHPFFPINKPLWTSSYALFTAGYALLVLAALYWVVDVRRWRAWTSPLLVFGTNAILAFALSVVLAKSMALARVGEVSLQRYVYREWFAPLAADPRNASLAFAVSFVLVCWLLLYPLYRKRLFLKV